MRFRIARALLGVTAVALIGLAVVVSQHAGREPAKPVSPVRLAKNLRSVYNQRAAFQHIPVRAVASSCKRQAERYVCRLILLAAPSGVHCSRLYVKAGSHGFKVVSFGSDPYCPEGDKL